MPLKLIAPREGKSPNWSIRGTYLGCYCDRSTGTGEKTLAKKILKDVQREIERGAIGKKKAIGFAAAAAAYMNAGGENRYLAPLIKHFGSAPLDEITQIAIDNAAAALYPDASAPTRCREVYTPMRAVLHRAGLDRRIKAPKGSKSAKRVSWLRPEQAFALFAAADELDAELGLLIRLFCYTGMRRSEVLRRITIANIDLNAVDAAGRPDPSIYVPKTKNGDARQVHLTPELASRLAVHLATHGDRGRADPPFKFRINGYLQDSLARALKAAGLSFPPGQNGWHLFRHTYAMWMRKYAGLDTSGLVEIGAWKDRDSAARYEHLDATEEARKADLLPTMRVV